MIVQCCLNGARKPDFHARLPWTPDAIVADAAAVVAAGANEIHVHMRGDDGRESLSPAVVDPLIARLRAAIPGTLIGVSTGSWIERDHDRRLSHIAGWQEPPDYASVNLLEAGAPEVIDRLRRQGISIEAGVWTVADAARLAELNLAPYCLRVLVEIHADDAAGAVERAEPVLAELERGNIRRAVLLHGFNGSAWPLVHTAGRRRYSTRIGLEDVKLLPDGTEAADNAALVRAALQIMRGSLAA